jgi:NADH:ubiquinone oxidoreductase subunit F (NADH-binding)
MTAFPPPPAQPRLFAAQAADLAAHQSAYGALPDVGSELIAMIDRAGLSGRGGGGFPTGRKLATVTGRKPVVVGNGAEGEPLSRKDAHLLSLAPHLVLDGLDAAASAIGADKVYLYLHAGAVGAVNAALAERRSAGLDRHRVEVVAAPDRFVAGEESAAIRRIEGGPALPRDRTVVTAVSGVRGRPTLVNNVETLAHMALIARFGPEWFRSVGDEEHPGTMLVTLSGALNHRGVVEVATDALLMGLLEAGGTDLSSLQAVLVDGYHGTWIPADEFGSARLSRSSLKPLGATPGAGIIHGLGVGECGLAATAEITAYLAEQSARQCGPCLNGLPQLAGLVGELASGGANDHLVTQIRRMAGLVDGRGSCRHPDGTARMVRSALTAFSAEIDLHRQRECCAIQ